MMYFTESAWAPSNMRDVNEEFERDHDTPAYEAKVAKIAATAQSRAVATGELSTWKEAIRVLRQEDHYLLVLLAAPTNLPNSLLRDRLKLVGTALLIVLCIMAGIILFSSRH